MSIGHPNVHSSIGRTEMDEWKWTLSNGNHSNLLSTWGQTQSDYAITASIGIVNVTCPLDINKCPFVIGQTEMSIGPTEMSIGHSHVRSSIGRTEMSIGHSNVHSSIGRNRNVHWTFKCPFVHWTNRNIHWTSKCLFVHWMNGHCLIANRLVSNPHGSDSVKLRHYSFLALQTLHVYWT